MPQVCWMEAVASTVGHDALERAVVYLDERLLQPGEAVRVGRETWEVPWAASIVFVDLAPRENWAHPCVYLFVNPLTGESIPIQGELPPFLIEDVKTLRPVFKGGSVPTWAAPEIEARAATLL